ncbi:hypothetical protein LINGRAPRIM_LOCUS277 [Linum grandiflorum]
MQLEQVIACDFCNALASLCM